jgi:hypothetical protein
MRTRILHAVGAAALLLSLGTVASADSDQVRAFIPFDFVARGTTLPSGTYFVTPQFQTNELLNLSGMKGGVFIFGNRVDTGSKAEPTRLVFHRYGDRYFLHEIWLDGGKGYQMPQTTQERELLKAESAPPVASVIVYATRGSTIASSQR